MPEYILGNPQQSVIRVRRNSVFFLCRFQLPESVKEQMAYADICQVGGDYVLAFYCDPIPGDRVTWGGYEWHLVRRHHTPVKRKSRQKKQVTTLIFEWEGSSWLFESTPAAST
ncbi:MAG: hypothetical protein AAFV72_11745 [Cyanobacteria bacterium J06635_1]